MNNAELIRKAIKLAGGLSKVASEFEISPQAVNKMVHKGVPSDRVIPLSELSGWEVTPHDLDSSLYPHADDGMPADRRGVA